LAPLLQSSEPAVLLPDGRTSAIELDPDYWKARINLDALEAAQNR
jgi:hypothetical protein